MNEIRNSPKQLTWRKGISYTLMLLLLHSTLLAFSTVQAASNNDDDDDDRHPRPGNIQARGSFTCDFMIPAGPLNIAPVIERDRMFMAARPGMLRKQIPIAFDAMGNVLSGGRYLFDKRNQAEKYKEWVETEFVLDGTLFFDRPYFLNRDCHSWRVMGAHNFQDVSKQAVVRTERFSVPRSSQMHLLRQRWPQIKAAAAQRGLTGAWLLYNKEEQLRADCLLR